MDNEIQDLDIKEPKIYEVGYLLLPTITPEAIADEANKILSVIETNGGSQVSVGSPEMKELAYSVSREIDRKRKHFDRAYFGWLRYQAGPEKASSIKTALDENPSILRFLIVTTTRGAGPARDLRRKVTRRPITEEKKASLTYSV